MWRKIGVAMIAAAVLATPVLAIETTTAPATVPAKIHSAAQAKMKAKTPGQKSPGKIAKNSIGKLKIAKDSKSKAFRKQPTRLTAGLGSNSGNNKPGNNKQAKAGTNGRHMAAKPPRQHVTMLRPKTKQQIKGAEPVETTTGSVAPRSVSKPRLY